MSKIKKIALICIAVFVAIIIAGSITFGVAGLNYDSSVVGTVEIQVELGEYAFDSDVKNDFKSDIEKIVNKEFDIAEDTRVYTESGTYATLVFSVNGGYSAVNSIADAKDSDFEQMLTAYFASQGVDFDYATDVSVEKVGGTYSLNVMVKSAIAIAVIALAVCVYMAFRFGIASALLSFVSVILETLVFLCLIAITRIPVGGQSVIALWTTLATSLIVSIIYNCQVRAEKKSVEEGTWEERVDRANKKGCKVIFRTLVAIIGSLIVAVALVPVKIKIMVALVALSMLVIGVNAILVKPSVRYWMGLLKKEKKTGYALHAKQKETKV